MTNGHAELHAVDLEKLARVAGHIKLFFGRVELVLALDPLKLTFSVNDEGGDLSARIGEPFHAEDRRYAIFTRPLSHGAQGTFLLRLVERPHVKILPAQSRQVGFGETGDLCALRRSLRKQSLDTIQSIIKA